MIRRPRFGGAFFPSARIEGAASSKKLRREPGGAELGADGGADKPTLGLGRSLVIRTFLPCGSCLPKSTCIFVRNSRRMSYVTRGSACARKGRREDRGRRGGWVRLGCGIGWGRGRRGRRSWRRWRRAGDVQWPMISELGCLGELARECRLQKESEGLRKT